MSSREHILNKIKTIPRATSPLPVIPAFGPDVSILELFCASIEANKGRMITEEELHHILKEQALKKIVTPVSQYEELATMALPDDPHDLSDLDLAIVKGQFGVAENGAIWLEDEDLVLRALPFITEHLIIVLDQKDLVSNMHQAYKRIGSRHSGFGVFVAGPSKTADIEQSLVIGAHGAKSLGVMLR